MTSSSLSVALVRRVITVSLALVSMRLCVKQLARPNGELRYHVDPRYNTEQLINNATRIGLFIYTDAAPDNELSPWYTRWSRRWLFSKGKQTIKQEISYLSPSVQLLFTLPKRKINNIKVHITNNSVTQSRLSYLQYLTHYLNAKTYKLNKPVANSGIFRTILRQRVNNACCVTELTARNYVNYQH